jgi:hypothetical protein
MRASPVSPGPKRRNDPALRSTLPRSTSATGTATIISISLSKQKSFRRAWSRRSQRRHARCDAAIAEAFDRGTVSNPATASR